ncbi:MAG: hypothetical protein ACM65L_21920 [Microcoleus sp.]
MVWAIDSLIYDNNVKRQIMVNQFPLAEVPIDILDGKEYVTALADRVL